MGRISSLCTARSQTSRHLGIHGGTLRKLNFEKTGDDFPTTIKPLQTVFSDISLSRFQS